MSVPIVPTAFLVTAMIGAMMLIGVAAGGGIRKRIPVAPWFAGALLLATAAAPWLGHLV